MKSLTYARTIRCKAVLSDKLTERNGYKRSCAEYVRSNHPQASIVSTDTEIFMFQSGSFQKLIRSPQPQQKEDDDWARP